jgi:peptidoglycan/xylan/chitin deacetylase (PgdA/CDA1 family)
MNQLYCLAKPQFLPWYYYGTWAFRMLALQCTRGVAMCPIPVLYYHRVADHCMNPWTISNRDFRQHIDWLAGRFEFVSLAEAQRRLAHRDSRRPAVCITFDDGYAENCEHALPLLVQRRIPVTYFVATQFIVENKPFPHDVERGEPLRPNSVAQLASLAEAGIEIGAHTRTHADLGSLTDRDALRREIVQSRDELQQLIGDEVRYFAFPYGQYNNLSVQATTLIRNAGFDGYCSAYGGYNFPRRDPFHLQRIHGDPNWLRFRNWMTLDPRIAFGVRRWSEEHESSCVDRDADESSYLPDETSVVAMCAKRSLLQATAVDGNDR